MNYLSLLSDHNLVTILKYSFSRRNNNELYNTKKYWTVLAYYCRNQQIIMHYLSSTIYVDIRKNEYIDVGLPKYNYVTDYYNNKFECIMTFCIECLPILTIYLQNNIFKYEYS